ncbi:hypothetical protein ACQJBY_031467 [Aegilops geniculata]
MELLLRCRQGGAARRTPPRPADAGDDSVPNLQLPCEVLHVPDVKPRWAVSMAYRRSCCFSPPTRRQTLMPPSFQEIVDVGTTESCNCALAVQGYRGRGGLDDGQGSCLQPDASHL